MISEQVEETGEGEASLFWTERVPEQTAFQVLVLLISNAEPAPFSAWHRGLESCFYRIYSRHLGAIAIYI